MLKSTQATSIGTLSPKEQNELFCQHCKEPDKVYMVDHSHLGLDEPCAATIVPVDDTGLYLWRCTTVDDIVYGCSVGLDAVKDAIVAAQVQEVV
jgi:hypothetical protein